MSSLGISITLVILLAVSVLAHIQKQPSPTEEVATPTSQLSSAPKSYALEYIALDADQKLVSPGLFFPTGQGKLINNPQPTITGILSQDKVVYLGTSFGKETSVINNQRYNHVRFLPGRLTSLQATIDDKKITSIQGFATAPMLACEGHQSVSTCLKDETKQVPPVYFFLQPDRPLAEGEHTLVLRSGSEEIGRMTFTIDLSYKAPIPQLPFSPTLPKLKETLSVYDSCFRGYHYPDEFLQIPTLDLPNKDLYIGLAFATSAKEVNASPENEVSIVLAGKKYPFFIPTAQYLQTFNRPSPFFIPLENLVVNTNQPAEISHIGPSGYFDYLEVFPLDLSGRKYYNHAVPWRSTTYSSCDG